MARISKLNNGDGDSILAVQSDKNVVFAQGRLCVIPGGKTAYITISSNKDNNSTFSVFSGQKTLRALAKAILKATK